MGGEERDLLLGRGSATHCGSQRSLGVAEAEAGYIRPVLCLLQLCPPLSAETHNRGEPAAAAEPSRLCPAPAQNQLECVKLGFEARSSLGTGADNQNGNLRWLLPLGVRPPPFNGTNLSHLNYYIYII